MRKSQTQCRNRKAKKARANKQQKSTQLVGKSKNSEKAKKNSNIFVFILKERK